MSSAKVTAPLSRLESAGLIRLAAMQPGLEVVFGHTLVRGSIINTAAARAACAPAH